MMKIFLQFYFIVGVVWLTSCNSLTVKNMERLQKYYVTNFEMTRISLKPEDEISFDMEAYWRGFSVGIAEAESEIRGELTRGMTVYSYGKGALLPQEFDVGTGLQFFNRFEERTLSLYQKGILEGHNARIMKEVVHKGLPRNSAKNLTMEKAFDVFRNGHQFLLSNDAPPLKFEDSTFGHLFYRATHKNKSVVIYNKQHYRRHYVTETLIIELAPMAQQVFIVWMEDLGLAVIQYEEGYRLPRVEARVKRHLLVLDPNYPTPRGYQPKISNHWIDRPYALPNKTSRTP